MLSSSPSQNQNTLKKITLVIDTQQENHITIPQPVAPSKSKPITRTIHLQSENDLHHKVVDFAKTFYPNALIVPGLEELQDAQWKRLSAWRKGYVRGQPDLLRLNHNSSYDGLGFESKSPTGQGVFKGDQEIWADRLASHNWKVVVSNDYDQIIFEITTYFRTSKLTCQVCGKWSRHMDKHTLRHEGWSSRPHFSFLDSSQPAVGSTQEPPRSDSIDPESLSVSTDNPAALTEAGSAS